MIRYFFLLTILLSGCANFFIRQECEKQNWYQLGYDAALRGERISNDAQVSRCRKAEAEISESQLDVGFKAGMSRYCQPETAFQTGRQGDTLNSDFCDTNILNLLQRKHAEGNKAYCSDGLTAGQSGKKYKNVCAAEFEKKFIPEYKKGRKKYISNLLSIADTKRKETLIEIQRVTNEKFFVDRKLSYIPLAPSGQADPYIADRSLLTNQSSSLSSQLGQIRYKSDQLQNEITVYQTELATLD